MMESIAIVKTMNLFITNKINISGSRRRGMLGMFFIFIFLLCPILCPNFIAEADDAKWPADPTDLQTSGKLVFKKNI